MNRCPRCLSDCRPVGNRVRIGGLTHYTCLDPWHSPPAEDFQVAAAVDLIFGSDLNVAIPFTEADAAKLPRETTTGGWYP